MRWPRRGAARVTNAASLNKRFAPIVCRRVEDTAIPEALRRLNFVFFDDQAKLEASAERLAEALRTDIGWIRKHTGIWRSCAPMGGGRPAHGLQLRSPVLEDAEHWIASRPRGAPEPTVETQIFVADSRRGATRRRNILTGSLAAGLVIALGLAGVAYWQRGIAVQQRQIADQQRKRAEDTLAAATRTANSLVFDLAQKFRFASGIPVTLIKDILDRAIALQQQLIKSGEGTPDLNRSEAEALDETVDSLLAIGDTNGALAAAKQAREIFADLLAQNPSNTDYQRELSVSHDKVGDVLLAQGQSAEALKSSRNSLAIRGQLARADPGTADWQRGLSVAYNKVGDVLKAQGDLPEALKSYHRNSLAIRDPLARANPGDADWQRDLLVGNERVGDVLVARAICPRR